MVWNLRFRGKRILLKLNPKKSLTPTKAKNIIHL